MSIIIFNKNKDYDASWCDEKINIMRPFLLKNPFPITRIYTRAEVIKRFSDYFYAELEKDKSPIALEIKRLHEMHMSGKTIALICCCEPLPCHGEIVKSAIENHACK